MNRKNTRRGFTQYTLNAGDKQLFTSPLAGEVARSADEGVLKGQALFSPPHRGASALVLSRKGRGKQRGGFTLIELLVVVLIIGILAAVALPQYQKAVEKSRATEAILFLNNLKKAVDLYLMQHTITEDVCFLEGCPYGGKLVETDITFPPFTCVDNDFGTWCGTKDFVITALCDADLTCELTAVRATQQEREVEGYAQDGSYLLFLNRNKNDNWTHSCRGFDDMGRYICQSLKGTWW